MPASCVLYGWPLSYFTAKVRSSLRYQGIPFVERPLNLWQLMVTVPRKTGATVMPVLLTPEGEWLQDSSDIIDHLEAQSPVNSLLPETPVQRFVAHLLEAWADEWWIPMAMHSRWSYPENYALFEAEAGASLLPGFPRSLQDMAAAHVARKLRDMCPRVGIRPGQLQWINRWSERMLDLLETHFAQHRYLLGERPTLADVALAGPFCAHLGRDPWPAREWIAPRQHLHHWVERMASPQLAQEASGLLLVGDAIAPTLEPVLETVLAEFVPLLECIHEQVQLLRPSFAPGKALPRVLADVTLQSRLGPFSRAALPYSLWMAQRVRDVHADMALHEQARVRHALQHWGSDRLLDLPLPRLQRQALRVAFAA
jgi:glutathione S-transferase